MSNGLELLFIVRLLQGVTLPCILTSGIQILSKIEDITNRKKCVGYYVSGTILGSTLSRFYPAITIDLLGWQIGFISCTGFLLLACYFIAKLSKNYILKPIEKEHKKTPYIRYLTLAFLEKRLLIAYCLGFGLLLRKVWITADIHQRSLEADKKSKIQTLFSLSLCIFAPFPLIERERGAIVLFP